ncbi:hypothetical protein JCM14036_04720 [Desulfotomaculum defluvii]
MKVLAADPNKCLGCRICEQWCSMFHYKVNNPKKSRISVVRSHATYMDYPLVCQQCEDTPCIKACPEKIQALSIDQNTGAIKLDSEKCIACGLCSKACPNQAIKKHPNEKYMLICDLCGGDPQCVKHCPGDALFYKEKVDCR